MSTPQKEEHCYNCQSKLIGSYCHTCGQKSTNKRTRFFDVFNALFSGIFSLERGLPGTLFKLVTQPQKVVQSYWKGFRQFYFSPAQMIVYTIFVLGLHIAFVSPQVLGVNVGITGISKEASSIFNPQLFFIILILPLLAVTSFLTFIKAKKTLAEHFILAIYIFTSWAIICTIISDFANLVFGLEIDQFNILYLFLMFLWNSRVMASARPWYYHLLFALAQVLVFATIIALLISILYLTDPSSIQTEK